MSMNGNVSYGRALLNLVGSQIPVFGNVFVVVNSSDAADPGYQNLQQVVITDTNGQVRLFTDLATAYAATTSNGNDVILLDGHSSHSLSTGLAITKSRVHFLGMDSGDRLVDQGAKIVLSGAVDSAYVIKNTGTRNTFRNIKFIQSSTHANALTVVQDGGEGAVYKNCSAIFGVADNLGSTSAHEFVAGSDSNTYIDCTFGADTLLTSAARAVFFIKIVTTSQEFKSNILRRCNFIISSSDAGAQFVKMNSASDALFTNLFDDCTFQASLDSAGGIALTRAVSTANGLVKGTLNFAYPRVFNCTDFGTNGTNNDQLQVVAPLVSNTDLVGVAPIAT